MVRKTASKQPELITVGLQPWVSALRTAANTLARKSLAQLTRTERITLGRYHAYFFENYRKNESKNRTRGVAHVSAFAELGRLKHYSDLTVRQYFDAIFGLARESGTMIRSPWAIKGAVGPELQSSSNGKPLGALRRIVDGIMEGEDGFEEAWSEKLRSEAYEAYRNSPDYIPTSTEIRDAAIAAGEDIPPDPPIPPWDRPPFDSEYVRPVEATDAFRREWYNAHPDAVSPPSYVRTIPKAQRR